MTTTDSNLGATVVLLAEDDPDMRAIIAGELERAQYEVRTVRDGDELWRELENLDDAPDVVISDVRMPGVDGLEVLARLRERDWFMPVILMTAYGDASTHLAARRLGARVLDKPVELERLVVELGELVNPA